eukprot:GHVS01091252.1.p1 GENE.GHVS01091252.1~~GHVS01091252.1.p1  ORF type:complete len:258 (+),score=31.42 GHVS01091252.1:312-1085(+)
MYICVSMCSHAGYSFSGKTAAWSWAQLNSKGIDRIFVLGPSHHVHLSNCALPSVDVTGYQTPLGNISLDQTVLEDLRCTGEFGKFDLADDQDEHSIELQLPYIAQVMGSKRFTLVPIVVGHLSEAAVTRYGDLLLPYFRDTKTVFVISSDFCHWGRRFRYSYILPECKHLPLHQAIEELDRKGIALIEQQNSQGFNKYLEEHNNTICGQNPIRVLLSILDKEKDHRTYTVKLLDYSQSQQAMEHSESSVSYASVVVF